MMTSLGSAKFGRMGASYIRLISWRSRSLPKALVSTTCSNCSPRSQRIRLFVLLLKADAHLLKRNCGKAEHGQHEGIARPGPVPGNVCSVWHGATRANLVAQGPLLAEQRSESPSTTDGCG